MKRREFLKKINTYFNFLENLDMNFYTENYLKLNKNLDNKKILRIIVIHKGIKDNGHYYLYAKILIKNCIYMINK